MNSASGNGFVPPDHRVVRPRADAVVVEILGEHDLASRDTIQRLFLELVADNELVVVDVSEAAFVDSTFINALVKARKFAEEKGSQLRVQLGTAPIVRKVFELSDLLDYLECANDREEALGS